MHVIENLRREKNDRDMLVCLAFIEDMLIFRASPSESRLFNLFVLSYFTICNEGPP